MIFKNNCLKEHLWLYQNEKNQNQSVIKEGLIRKLRALT